MTEPEERAAPKRKAKKRRKKRGAPESAESSPSRPATARPPFAKSFPDDPVIDRILLAFEVGNHAYVRDEARRLVDQSDDPALQDAGAEMLRRLKPDPISAYLIGLAALLLCFFSIWYWTHPHP